MIFKMTQRVRLLTEKDLKFERVFEIKVLDLRGRNNIKQRSFSVLVPEGTKDNEYISTEKMKNFIEKKVTEGNK